MTGAERAAIGHIPVGRGILGVLIDDARPLRLHDIAEDPRSVGLPPNHPPMRSFLGVPVKAGGRVYGNLYMTEKAGGEDFDADDERALSLLAAQAGAAIEAANLFEQANDRAQRLEAIRAISTAILAGTDTGKLLGLIVRHARALAGTDMAAVAVPVDGERLAVEAADGLLAGQLLGTVFPAEGSVTGDVIRTGKAVVLADAGADPRVAQPIVAAGAGPAVFIPLAVRGRILGTLTVANGRGGPLLRDSEVQLVETFAEQAAVALEYGRLQGQLQRLAVLEVDDNGRGFDPAAATGAGQGLRNLRERAEGLGGRVEIDSSPGQGTRVRVTIPR